MLPDLPQIFSKSSCVIIKSLVVNSYWEAVSRAASQILRILGNPQFHYFPPTHLHQSLLATSI